MVRASARSLVIVAALVLAAACGSSGGTSGGSGGSSPTPTAAKTQHVASVDACSLVSADDASAAAGSPVTNLGAGGGVQIPGACIFGPPTSSTPTPGASPPTNATIVIVFAQVYPDATTADAVQPNQLAAAMAGQFGVTNAHEVSGIGDKAVEYTATSSGGGGGIAIFVFKYNVVMLIAVQPSSNASAVEQLARTAVSKLVVS